MVSHRSHIQDLADALFNIKIVTVFYRPHVYVLLVRPRPRREGSVEIYSLTFSIISSF